MALNFTHRRSSTASGPEKPIALYTTWEHRGGVRATEQRDQQIPRPMPALELAVAPHAATRSCATAALEDASS